jgi:hypothetical protein
MTGNFSSDSWDTESKWIGGKDINGDWHGEDDFPDKWNVEFDPFKAMGLKKQ